MSLFSLMFGSRIIIEITARFGVAVHFIEALLHYLTITIYLIALLSGQFVAKFTYALHGAAGRFSSAGQ